MIFFTLVVMITRGRYIYRTYTVNSRLADTQTNCDFETPIPHYIVGRKYILVLGGVAKRFADRDPAITRINKTVSELVRG